MSLRILSIAPTSFFNDYGCHVRILEEARALQALGHEVTVVTYFKGNDVPRLRIIRTSPTPWHANYEVGSSRHKFAFDALLGIRLLRVLARNRFDIVHGHLHEGALLGGILARPWGVPVCMDYQGSLTDEMLHHGFMRADGKRERVWRVVERMAERSTQAIFTSTIHAATTLRAAHPDRRVEALTDGVNTNEVAPNLISPAERAQLRAQFGIGPDEHVVIFLGLLARHQGIQNLIDAAAMLKTQGHKLRWLVMGFPGIDVWKAQAQANGVAAEMVFGGRVPYLNMPRILALGDVAAAPKLSLTEGSGKILNYMAMGLPTVAFDTPAQRELLGEYGIYAPVGDTAALANGIAATITNTPLRAELGQKLRSRAQQFFSWEQRAKLMVEVYEWLRRQHSSK